MVGVVLGDAGSRGGSRRRTSRRSRRRPRSRRGARAGARSRAGSRARCRRWPARSRTRTRPAPRDDAEQPPPAAAPRRGSATPGGSPRAAARARPPSARRARGAAARQLVALGEERAEVLDLRGGGGGRAHDCEKTASSAAKPSSVAPGQSPRAVLATAHPHPPVRSAGRYRRGPARHATRGDHPSVARDLGEPGADLGRRGGPRVRRPSPAAGARARRGRPAGPAPRVARIGRRRVAVVAGHVALAEGHACRSAARRA